MAEKVQTVTFLISCPERVEKTMLEGHEILVVILVQNGSKSSKDNMFEGHETFVEVLNTNGTNSTNNADAK